MDHKEIYKNQMAARLELMKDPAFMQAIVLGMRNFKHACKLQHDESGKEAGYMNANKVEQIFNIMFPYILQSVLDIQVDFLPNNVVENLSDEVKKLNSRIDGLIPAKAGQKAVRPAESDGEASG